MLVVIEAHPRWSSRGQTRTKDRGHCSGKMSGHKRGDGFGAATNDSGELNEKWEGTSGVKSARMS